MGIFNSIFGKSSNSNQQSELPWTEVTTLEQIDEIIMASMVKPQLIFKHSTRCGISTMVLNRFNVEFNIDVSEVDLYYLDLLNHRDISEEIAIRFQIIHQSPQLLIIKDGIASHSASHAAINDIDFKKFL